MHFIETIDIKLFYLINVGMQNGFLDLLMPWITRFKNWYPVIAPTAVALIIWGGKRGRVALVVIIAAAGLSDFTASSIIKPLVERIRPCSSLANVHTLVSCTNSFSFPSSHASNIFALAVTGSYYFRKAAIPLFVLAFLVGYSRIYVGVHYPFDVMGGYIWGGVAAVCVILLERKIYDVRRSEAK